MSTTLPTYTYTFDVQLCIVKKNYFNICKNVEGLLLFLGSIGYIQAQNTSKVDQKLYYQITCGVGAGSGHQLHDAGYGIDGVIEIALQKNKGVLAIGLNDITDISFFDASNVDNSASSAHITYGRVYKKIGFTVV